MACLGVEACLSLEEKELFFSSVGTGRGLVHNNVGVRGAAYFSFPRKVKCCGFMLFLVRKARWEGE